MGFGFVLLVTVYYLDIRNANQTDLSMGGSFLMVVRFIGLANRSLTLTTQKPDPVFHQRQVLANNKLLK